IAGKVSTTIAAALAAQDVPAEAATGRVISELDRVSSRRDALAAEIEEAFLSCPSGELLASMPGIGPRTGARILAEIGDGSAFTNGSKLAAYAGLAPVTCQSGTTLNGETRSRRGNHRLKNAKPSPAAWQRTWGHPPPPAAALPASTPCLATADRLGSPGRRNCCHRTPESNSIAMVVQAPRWTLALTGKAVGAGALSMFSGTMV
ncbi:MAG: transposase, partial [Actinomycetia bacterium]|nr:transposase [Actinomycetes bacterium]